MKIVYVSPFPPACDGIGTYTEAIADGMMAQGHQIRVVVPRAESVNNSYVMRTLTPRRADLVAIRDSIVAWQPDCIHVQFAVAAFATRTPALLSWLRLMRATGIPIVVTMHEVTRDIGLLHSAGRFLYRAIAARCDRVIVHTQAALEACVDDVHILPARVTVIPHPTASPPVEVVSDDELRGRFGLGDCDLLLAFGFVHVDKGLRDLVDALSIIRDRGIPSLDRVRLVIAGTVRRRSGLFRLFELRDKIHLRRVLGVASRNGLDRNIVLTGYVPAAEIAGWFRAAAVVMLPYRRTEQSGVAALANAFRVPVLASTVGGLRELYGGSAWTFPPRDPPAIARALTKFLALKDSARAVTRETQPAAELAAVISATTDVYLSVSQNQKAERLMSS